MAERNSLFMKAVNGLLDAWMFVVFLAVEISLMVAGFMVISAEILFKPFLEAWKRYKTYKAMKNYELE